MRLAKGAYNQEHGDGPPAMASPLSHPPNQVPAPTRCICLPLVPPLRETTARTLRNPTCSYYVHVNSDSFRSCCSLSFVSTPGQDRGRCDGGSARRSAPSHQPCELNVGAVERHIAEPFGEPAPALLHAAYRPEPWSHDGALSFTLRGQTGQVRAQLLPRRLGLFERRPRQAVSQPRMHTCLNLLRYLRAHAPIRPECLNYCRNAHAGELNPTSDGRDAPSAACVHQQYQGPRGCR